MYIFRFSFVCSIIFIIIACGSNITPVSGVTVTNIRYTGVAEILTVNLVGDALTASGMKVYANGGLCTNDTSTSETSRSAFCMLTVPDDLRVQIRVTNGSGQDNYNSTFTAPMPQFKFSTNLADLIVELDPIRAPVTVKNFLSYVNKSPSFYNSTIFHRVIAGFMVQGGGFTHGMVVKSG